MKNFKVPEKLTIFFSSVIQNNEAAAFTTVTVTVWMS